MTQPLLSRFYADWFAHPKWWFSATEEDDAYITSIYRSLLEESHTVFSTPQDRLAQILVHDQLPRHVYRLSPEKDQIISQHLLRAVALADDFCDDDMEILSSEEICFALLPYRHTQIPRLVFEATSKAWAILKKRTGDTQLKRFLKAAYARAPMNQIQSTRISFPGYYESTFFNKRWVDFIDTYEDILDQTQHDPPIWFPPKYVYPNHPLFMAVSKCLEPLGNNTHVIVSLSGGVDSMILSYIIALLHPVQFLKAVHIDYGNRTTSAKEAAFVEEWCKYLGITCLTRRINEINRHDCMENGLRSTYETYTRNIRYNTYKISSTAPIVFLGHNLDDSFENILTNIRHTAKYENLLGMEVKSIADGITFYRPMIHINKRNIYDFAHKNNIPYLFDSTVGWSQRGQIRDAVVPTLNAWDEHAIPAFFELAKNSAAMYQILDSLVDTFVSQTQQGILQIPKTLSVIGNELFWRHYVHRLLGRHLSNASLKCFVERLQKFIRQIGNTKMVLSKEIQVHASICEDNLTLAFKKDTSQKNQF